jgi:ubiquinone/menaquinone biosynthesis C-methylase UbiE
VFGTFRKNRVCPAELAGSLDNRFRRWFQDPLKILGPFIREGMSVMDVGCGPGFFTLDMARLVGTAGRVTACDLQGGMLRKLMNKIRGTELETRIALHQCREDRLGVEALGQFDFVLLFYVVHEVPDQARLFSEVISCLKPGGRVFVVEPPIHVSKKEFEKTVETAEKTGLKVIRKPDVFFSKTVLLEK